MKKEFKKEQNQKTEMGDHRKKQMKTEMKNQMKNQMENEQREEVKNQQEAEAIGQQETGKQTEKGTEALVRKETEGQTKQETGQPAEMETEKQTEKQAEMVGDKQKFAWRTPKVADMRFTLEKPYGSKRVTRTELTITELQNLLVNGEHRSAVMQLRRELPTQRGPFFDHPEVWKVGRVVPSCLRRKERGQLKAKVFNGVVLLDIQDVYSVEDARRLKERAASMPMTLGAFVGSSGMSLKVLVRYWPVDGRLSRDWGEVEALHRAAYRQAVATYSAVLGRKLKENPDFSMSAGFRLSIDDEAVWNMSATVMLVSPTDGVDGRVETPAEVPPADSRHYHYYFNRYLDARGEVLKRFREEHRDTSIESEAFMQAVTAKCFEMQIPVAEARMHIIDGEPEERALAWGNYVNDYYAEHSVPAGIQDKKAKGVREMQALLMNNYEMYLNEIDGSVYYRPRNTRGRWQLLDETKQAGMMIEALEAGAVTSINVVKTFLLSDRIPRRNPLTEFLNRVKGLWDGIDRITMVARAVAQGNPLWELAFHIWFLSMVQQWMGIHREHGNAVVPLLCGPQGTGKSTFCRSLLPDELMWGYLDHIDLTKREHLMRLMAQMLLINIDEFDQYRGDSQRGPLKNLLQMADVRTKQMWRSNMQVRQRLASFIATSNPTEVLVDETGSRRFICVRVDNKIELPANLDYIQLYAQAVDEINARRDHPERFAEDDVYGRCYFTDEERDAIENNNQRFRVRSFAVERFCDCFEMVSTPKLRGDASTVELTRSEVVEFLERHSNRRFSREDFRQLYAYLDHSVDEGQLYKRRSKKANVFHLKRKVMPIV